jgi:hypothetical protein
MPNGYENEICGPHTVLLHDTEELDNNLGGWSDQDLPLSGLLSVVDGIERIVEDGGLHGDGLRFSDREIGNEVSTKAGR